MVKPDSHLLTTAVIGSWPKPTWLSKSSPAVDLWEVDRTWQFEGEELHRKQDDATEWALREQESTGVDVVSDGEIRRENYIYYYCRHLDGFNFERRARIEGRGGAATWLAPTITGPIRSQGVFLATDYQFVRDRTDRRIKVAIPGPLTIIDSMKDEYYEDEAELAMDLATAIRVDVEALAAAGADLIQFDEPVFVRYPEKVSDFGLRALERCFEGVSGIATVVHMCFSYSGFEGYRKAPTERYGLLAPMLATSKIDQISIEAAHRPLDLRVIQDFGQKDIEYGVVDVGSRRVETVEEIAGKIRAVLEHVDPSRLSVSPDCGMTYLDSNVATGKLTNLVQAAQRVRDELLEDRSQSHP
ncbi:MAG: 5-methyltetrahydropteroyltriglutamate--homocysteine methyltransferase [Chloroflexi bacterium]|nr:5-methyltetrahydropteroyltriglutamate--homocysteine methyltransferase [Chloroflexota bacterium]